MSNMGRKIDSGMIWVLLALIVLGYALVSKGVIQVLSAQAKAVGIECATRSGTTSEGVPLGQRVDCDKQAFSIVEGRENIYNIGVRVTATAADRDFQNFKAVAASPEEFRQGLFNARPSIIESGAVTKGGSYTWSTIQKTSTFQSRCRTGGSYAPSCDSSEELVYFTDTGTCECWLKAKDFEKYGQPVVFSADVEGTWQGGTEVIQGTTTAGILPDVGGGFSVDVQVVS